MRATRAYIASAGTAAVLLGAALTMLVLVSGFVAVGSWPGASAHTGVDQVILRETLAAAPAKDVRVRSDAVAIARRAQAAERRRATAAPRVVGFGPAPVAALPRAPQRAGGAPAATAPAPTAAPQQQVQQAPQQVEQVTREVGTQLEQQVQNVQTQVGAVVEQVIDPDSTAGRTAETVTTTAGSVVGR